MTNISSGGVVERAWDIHKDADAIFHHRLNAYLTAQAFLAVAFATAYSAAASNGSEKTYALLLACLVGVAGLTLSMILQRVINTAYDRLLLLKRSYLASDTVYWKYLTLGDPKREELTDDQKRADIARRWHWLVDGVPLVVNVFWIAALVLVGHFFLKVGQ